MSHHMAANTTARYRAVSVGSAPVEFDQDSEGVWHLRSKEALAPYPERLGDCLRRGAEQYPQRTLAAQRGADGAWVHLSYAQLLQQARAIGQALRERGLGAERPLMILSGNDLAHLQLALGALYAGIPYCPVSPAYSLVAQDFDKLAGLVRHMTPGLVFASDGAAFGPALAAVVPDEVEIALGHGNLAGRAHTPLSELLATPPGDIDRVNAAVGPDSIAKFLFTSGSTREPKAVITTHRMLCSNQQMLLQSFPCFGEEPPVLVDWLPWNHTFGGSHNFGIALYNGGSYYIDGGKPTTQGFGETLRNLKEIAPTVFFNVPKGWEMLAEALEQDDALADMFYSRVRLFFFAGAGLSQAAWDKLERVTEARCGERIRIMAGLGMTECSPSCTFTTGPVMQAGYVGLPAPGCEARLVPVDGKLEARFKGPHVMPGYWRAAEHSAAAFDEAGYYRSGDAVRFYDAAQPQIGLMFDGRIAEDFKLSSGTFVSVGPLRARVISEGAPYVLDAVVTGLDRDEIGLLLFPRLEHCASLAGLAEPAGAEAILSHAAVRACFAALLRSLNRQATGSASRISRLCLMTEAPSIDHGEITDKGSINQRAVLNRRSALVTAMYAGNSPHLILAPGWTVPVR
ncbi:feruloyl-CoA synthase [Vogesella sp. LIG4]|uniref:feruloyl-CoA synthase n=1 Tax=Vogesella sp. LIG4 TaxID=1192162 RepID=UPI00081FC730|nr:feruloyl-CoA synthase [Vogesella sp. LIG4]SCK30115.1 trans-feruloyl-CoA synthase [Vogesella sp. LIG4]